MCHKAWVILTVISILNSCVKHDYLSICIHMQSQHYLDLLGGLHWHGMERKKQVRVPLKSRVCGTNSAVPHFSHFCGQAEQ